MNLPTRNARTGLVIFSTIVLSAGGNAITCSYDKAGDLLRRPVAPGLYTFNQQGTGIAAAFSLRVASGGTQTRDLLVEGDTLEPKPVDLGPAGDRVYLELFGAGMRGSPRAQRRRWEASRWTRSAR